MDDFVTTITQAHNEVMEALRWNATEIMEGPGVLSGVRDFIGAVEWEEPFFKWLFCAHFALAAVVLNVVIHHSGNTVAGLFMVLALSVFGAQYINDFGRQHFRTLFPLHETNYFDTNGTFISAIFSAPLLFWAFVLQLRLLVTVSKMLVVVKRRQAQAQAKQAAASTTKAGNTGPVAANQTAAASKPGAKKKKN
jgi:hypothetical protein